MLTITNTTPPKVRRAVLKAHLKMHAAGMKHSKMTGAELLAMVTDMTGKTYKRGQYETAIADLIAMNIEEAVQS